MRLAVLEVGSNAIRLASAVLHPSGTLELVLRQHIPLRLGETVFQSGGVTAAVLHALTVERASNHVIPYTGKVLSPPAAYQHHRVLLKVMTLTAYVGCNLIAVSQTYTTHLT